MSPQFLGHLEKHWRLCLVGRIDFFEEGDRCRQRPSKVLVAVCKHRQSSINAQGALSDRKMVVEDCGVRAQVYVGFEKLQPRLHKVLASYVMRRPCGKHQHCPEKLVVTR